MQKAGMAARQSHIEVVSCKHCTHIQLLVDEQDLLQRHGRRPVGLAGEVGRRSRRRWLLAVGCGAAAVSGYTLRVAGGDRAL